MALAVFVLYQKTDDPGNETDTSKSTAYQAANQYGGHTSNPIPVPAPAGSPTYSYEVWLFLKCSTAPDNQVINFKVYGSDEQPDEAGAGKLTQYIGTEVSWAAPVQTASSKATDRVDTTRYSPGTALAVGVVPSDDKISEVDEQTDYIVHQLKVEEGAAFGNMELQQFVIQYEES